MAYALRALGKDVTIVNKDAAPGPIMQFPGVDAIVIASEVVGELRSSDHHGMQRPGAHRASAVWIVRS